jgi:hypothetical protein
MKKKTIILLAFALAKLALKYILAKSEYDFHHNEYSNLVTIFENANKLYTLFIGYYATDFDLKSKIKQLILEF